MEGMWWMIILFSSGGRVCQGDLRGVGLMGVGFGGEKADVTGLGRDRARIYGLHVKEMHKGMGCLGRFVYRQPATQTNKFCMKRE